MRRLTRQNACTSQLAIESSDMMIALEQMTEIAGADIIIPRRDWSAEFHLQCISGWTNGTDQRLECS